MRGAQRLLTRIRDSLKPASPVEDEHALLEGLWASEPTGVRDPSQGLAGSGPMTDEPGADDDARPPASGPAVDIYEPSRLDLGVDLVQRRDEGIPRRDREVADRPVQISGGGRHERGVRLEFACLREIDEQRDARDRQVTHLGRGVLRAPRAGMAPGDEAARLDDRRRTHDGEVCRRVRYPVRGERLKRRPTGADMRGMERLDTSAAELRDRALTLANELQVDPGTWYVRVLDEGRREGIEPDLGALVRVYWELQRLTGRAELRDTWRLLADQLWSGEAA